MQNNTHLNNHNEVITVSEPWHRGTGFTWMLLALAGVVFFLSGAVAKAQETVYWRSAAPNANWANAGDNNWYRAGDGWDVRRPDLANNQWSTGGTRSYNVVIFDNGSHATTTVNAEGGAKFDIYQLLLRHGSSRTLDSSGGGYFSLGGGSGNAKIETESGATGTYTFNVPLTLAKTTEINAVNGNMVFNSGSTIDTDGFTLQSYTSGGKQLELKGVISDSGGFQHKGGGLVILEGNNTFSGATTVEGGGGVLQIKNGSALGSAAAGTTVSDGATLEIYGSLGTINEAITISGLGSGGNGALRNFTGETTLGGGITLNANARVNTDSGNLTVAGGITGNSNVLRIAGAGNTTVSSAISGGGASHDGTTTSLYKEGSGTLTLSGGNSYTGDTRIVDGTLTVASGGSLGSGSDVFVSSGATLNVNANTTVASIRETASGNGGTAAIGTDATLTVNQSADTQYFNAVTGNGALTKSGAGRLSLYGTSSKSGANTVSGGVLEVQAGASLAGNTTIGSGGTLDADGSLSGSVTVNDGGTVEGSGSVGALTIASGGTLNPGNSPGTLTASSATWNGGGTYDWEIKSLTGGAGIGWDLLDVNGLLNIQADAGSPFTIALLSLDSLNAAGALAGFNAASTYTFAIAYYDSQSGFSTSAFDIDDSAFNTQNPNSGIWSLETGSDGGQNAILLRYTGTASAIPEPSVASMFVLGLSALLANRRRRA